MEIKRRKTKNIMIGSVGIGSAFPVSIQSMTTSDTRDVTATLEQIRTLAAAGCDIVRVAVIDEEAANALSYLVRNSPLPLIADIHFDYRLAILSIKNGVHGLRLNPGNIGSKEKIREVVKYAREFAVPIRIGVNSGSLEKEIMAKYGGITAGGMVESAAKHIAILEEEGFDMIKVSLKSSSVPMMIQAYREIAAQTPYPLHLGVTEAGLFQYGSIKSAVGIGTLLAQGIGDTIRVSLTGNPAAEIEVARMILKSLHLRKQGVEILSCPTCGRCQVDLYRLAQAVEEMTREIKEPLTIAVMGCVVNGPGEAREADLGIACGKGNGLVFVKGQIKAKVPEPQLLDVLSREIEKYLREGA